MKRLLSLILDTLPGMMLCLLVFRTGLPYIGFVLLAELAVMWLRRMLFMHNQRVWGHEKLQLVISLIGIVAGRYLYDRVYVVQTQLSVVTDMVTAFILLLYAVIWILLQKFVENRLNGNK